MEAQRWRVPASHRDWLEALAVAIDLELQGERYWAVHAGVPTDDGFAGLAPAEVVPHLAQHSAGSLLWSAVDPETMVPLDRPVIMGHTPRRRPLDAGHVIALDTGSGSRSDGLLTAVVLAERRFVSAGRS